MLENMLTPVLPSHLNSLWGMDASKVGLVLLASVIPSIFGAQNVLYVLCYHLNGLRLFRHHQFPAGLQTALVFWQSSSSL